MPTVTNLLKLFNRRFPHTAKKYVRESLPENGLLMKAAKLLYLPYQWLIGVPLFVLSTVLFSLIAMILVPWKGPKATANYSAIPWARLGCYMIPVFLKIRGREHVDPAQSYVIAANHQSHVDILIIYGWIGIDFKWVMKESIRKIPFMGKACDAMGHVFIDRSNPAAAISSIERAKARIQNGTSILFFPEGTRSRDGHLQDFKKGAFRTALDLNLPILPVTINGTKTILQKNSSRIFPGKVEMIFHPPVETAPFTADRMEDLMKIVRASIQSELAS